MPAHPIDRLSVAVARGTTRRSFLAAAGAALGLAATRTTTRAGGSCSTDADCTDLPGLVCTSLGICGYPECVDYGETCSSDGDCCGDFICPSGVCTASPTCGTFVGADCTAQECCPGLICASGACQYPTTPPPENTGGGNTGGEGGGGSTEGGGSTSGGGISGTTTSGVVVSGLPSTGIGGDTIRREKWGLAAAALAGTAGLLGLSRRSANPTADLNTDIPDQ